VHGAGLANAIADLLLRGRDILERIEEALARAMAVNRDEMGIDEEHVKYTPEELAQDKKYRHQALEQVALHYIQTTVVPEPKPDTPLLTEAGK
jgi:hypothetical protein